MKRFGFYIVICALLCICLVSCSGKDKSTVSDELFTVAYASQLEDMTFTKSYAYGEDDVAPVLCMCSEKITDIKIFTTSHEDKSALLNISPEPIYSLAELLPTEVLALYLDVPDSSAPIMITFADPDGKERTCIIRKGSAENTLDVIKQ